MVAGTLLLFWPQ